MTVAVVVSLSHKSWAYGLEQCLEYRNFGDDVILLDLSRVVNRGIISNSRRRYQNHFCKENQIRQIVVRRFSLVKLKAWTKAVFFSFLFILHRNLILPTWDKSISFELWATKCRLAQTMGSKIFSDRDIPLKYLFRFLESALVATYAFRKFLQFSGLNKISLFNGRDTADAVLIRSCLDQSTKVEITERASDDTKYEIYEISPHYQPEWWEKAIRFWEECEGSNTIDLTSIDTYLERKVLGYDSFMGQKWEKYLDQDIHFQIPRTKYIVFFATSTHEFSPISEYNSNMGFPDQFEAVSQLLEVAQSLGYLLVIKRHPNSLSPLDGMDREEEVWDSFSSPNCKVLGPRIPVNIVQLAKGSDACFVWRSSVGVETAFAGVPTYALGSARWAWDKRVRTWNKADIRNAILEPKVTPSHILYVYGNYMARGGKSLKHFIQVNRNFAISPGGSRIYQFLLGRRIGQLGRVKELMLGRKVKRKV